MKKMMTRQALLNAQQSFRTPVLVSLYFQYYTRKVPEKKSLLVDFLLFFRCYYAPYRNTMGFKSDFIVSCVAI
jgi:hypothetical protein